MSANPSSTGKIIANEGYSGIVKLSNLNDLLGAKNDCVKIPEKSDGQISNKTISLVDCLACSGCISKDQEIIMSNEQNITRLKENLESSKLLKIAIISPQSIASYASFNKLDYHTGFKKIETSLKSAGVSMCLDQNIGRNLSFDYLSEKFDKEIFPHEESKSLPKILSACPGVVCFMETSHPTLLKNLSKIPSPPIALAHYIHNICDKNSMDIKDLFICLISPCFDRKLESMRENFAYSQRDLPNQSSKQLIDCVIGTNEMNQFIIENDLEEIDQHHNIDLKYQNICCELSQQFSAQHLFNVPHGSSDGYLEFILEIFIKKYSDKHDIKELKINEYFRGRGTDFKCYEIVNNGDIIFKCAKSYGIKNLSILTQKLKKSVREFDFVEAMACPRGCLNGGAQLEYKNFDELYEKYSENISANSKPEKELQYAKHSIESLKIEFNAIKRDLNVLYW